MNSPDRLRSPINPKNLYSRYPFVGFIKNWESDKRFGHIEISLSDTRFEIEKISRNRLIFAHIAGYKGNQSRNWFEQNNITAQRCLFTAGITPHEYKKNSKKLIAINWILEDDLTDPNAIDTYYQNRRETIILWSSSELFNALCAQWYIALWNNSKDDSYDSPKVKLNLTIDPPLCLAVTQHEQTLSTLQDYQRWLKLKLTSPYFVVSDIDKETVKNQLFETLGQQPSSFFAKTPCRELITLLEENGHLLPDNFWNNTLPELATEMAPQELTTIVNQFTNLDHKKNFITTILSNRTITLDIESNGEEIYQIGSYFDRKRLLETDSSPLTHVRQILEKLENNTSRRSLQWIVGHNITAWDLPILRKFHANFFQNLPVWDTLLMSWLLEPWKKSHALTTSEHAHQADYDAEATFELFQQQLQHCSLLFGQSQIQQPGEPIQRIYHLNESIGFVCDHRYPSLPDNITPRLRFIIVPQWRLWSELAWCPRVIHAYPHAAILSPEKLDQALQTDPDNIWLQVIATVVRDAANHRVQVVIEMLPAWLKERVGQTLQNCIDNNFSLDNYLNIGNYLCISTYAAYRDHISQLPDYAQLLYATESQLELIPEAQPLGIAEVTRLFLNKLPTLSAEALFKLSDETSLLQLFRQNQLTNFYYWLEYNPAILQEENRSCWRLHRFWRQLPPSLKVENSDSQDQSNSPAIAVFPRWQASGLSYTRLAEAAILPTSGNRLRYWEDTLSRLFALAAISPDETIIVLLVTNPSETEAIANALANMGKTYRVANSVLRQLETLRRRGMRLAVDIVANAPLWLEASETLGYPVQLVIESLPLHQWWICLNSLAIAPSTAEDFPTQLGEDLEQELDAYEDESDSDDDTGESEPEFSPSSTQYESSSTARRKPIPITLSESDVLSCLDRFLRPWLNRILQRETVESSPIILDSRFDRLRLNLVRQDIPIAPQTQEEEEQLIEALRDGLGELERQSAPTDYETYRSFLEANWGYQDFRENTQRPAIEAIIPNDKDVLVRLPTGEGKSVLFQVPALLRGFYTQRLTLVITPLRALMADQVKSLWAKGFLQSVDYLSGDRDLWVMDEVYQGIVDNRIKLLFVAPERFRVNRFRETLQRRHQIDGGLEYIVVDEAHCISQWGFEFRPDYLYAMKEIQRLYHDTHLLMFSATVTEAVRNDLEREAGMTEEERTYAIRPEAMRHPIQPFIQLSAENVGTTIYGNDLMSARVGYIERAIQVANPDISSIIVFVTRKKHAEALCNLLNERQEINARIEYFHAGLDSESRLEVYEAFLERQIQVLICTKAFGMGMDIPHIHWCIHLAPPPYLEDYLQEVGRIGRDHLLREEAGLNTLEGKLLYAPADFEKNHSQRQESRITPPMLIQLWDSIRENSRSLAQTNQQICIVPVDKFNNLKENALRCHLFWLEKCERIEIQSYLPGLIRIRIDRSRLEQSAREDGNAGLVARTLLKIYSLPSNETKAIPQATENATTASSGILDNLFNFAKGFLGFLFGSKPNATKNDSESNQYGIRTLQIQNLADEAEIKIDALWQKSDLPRLDDVYSALYQLTRAQSIEILRDIDFKKGGYEDIQPLMWAWLGQVLDGLLANSGNSTLTITKETVSEWMTILNSDDESQKLSERKIQAAQKRVMRSAIKLCNDSSLRIFEKVDEEKNVIWQYTFPNERRQIIERRLQNTQLLAREIANKLATKLSLSFTELLECCQTSISIRDLKAAIRLLSNLGLYINQKKLTSYSYILEVHKIDQDLLPPGSEGISDSDSEMYECLDLVNRMSELRSFAMELYALLPNEMQKSYIDRYFLADSPEALQTIIETSVGELDEETLQQNASLSNLLTQVRQEAFTQAIEQLSDEQREVCQFPYDKNLLVNAGPGAGKTHVLMMRCADLIYRQGLQPREILVLAFNRAVVYEIKKRISGLFTELGYGSYIKRLQVYTFHSFALKNLERNSDNNSGRDNLESLLHEFALRMRNKSEFRDQIGSQYRAVLIDEFQDMNEDFYCVIRSLQLASGAGVMVIGDDDQDILLWNRLKNQENWQNDFGQARLHAHQYFQDFQANFNAECLNLTFNYRSASSIVERSQVMANRVIHPLQERLKSEINLFAIRDELGIVNNPITNLEEAVKNSLNAGNNIAVLCRTNAEVSALYERFIECGFQPLQVQRSDDLKMAQIREIAEWLDICNRYLQDNNGEIILSEELFRQLVDQYNSRVLGNFSEGRQQIEILWQATLVENILRQHIDFINDLKTSDYERILRQSSSSSCGITISTINKVKGLEYDVVFVPSSTASFPLNNNQAGAINLADLAAEEARLYYVALTRAKNTLYFSWGDRERAWSRSEYFNGIEHGARFLEGSPEEVFISWPGFSVEHRYGSRLTVHTLQNYIKSQVRVNDLVQVNNHTIFHGNQRIAILKNTFSGNHNSRLRVSNIYRYPIDPQKVTQDIFEKIAPELQDRGWFYTVLLTGRL